MAQAYAMQLEQPKLHDLGFNERLALLLEHEWSDRHNRKLKRLVGKAQLPEGASLEEVDYRASRSLDKSFIATLSTCDWIRKQQNLIIGGPTGAGKTWLACAFAAQACRLGMSTSFHRAGELLTAIGDAVHDGSMAKLKQNLEKPLLLVIDDLGIGEMTLQATHVLFDVVDRRMRTGSLLITSQYPVDKWHDLFPDPTLADAILDRIVHQAHRLAVKGESMRKLRARKLMP
jgi:DNA replication protein DnaC